MLRRTNRDKLVNNKVPSSDNVYFDLTIANTTSTNRFENSSYAISQSVEILHKASDYYISVDSLRIPVDNIPFTILYSKLGEEDKTILDYELYMGRFTELDEDTNNVSNYQILGKNLTIDPSSTGQTDLQSHEYLQYYDLENGQRMWFIYNPQILSNIIQKGYEELIKQWNADYLVEFGNNDDIAPFKYYKEYPISFDVQYNSIHANPNLFIPQYYFYAGLYDPDNINIFNNLPEMVELNQAPVKWGWSPSLYYLLGCPPAFHIGPAPTQDVPNPQLYPDNTFWLMDYRSNDNLTTIEPASEIFLNSLEPPEPVDDDDIPPNDEIQPQPLVVYGWNYYSRNKIQSNYNLSRIIVNATSFPIQPQANVTNPNQRETTMLTFAPTDMNPDNGFIEFEPLNASKLVDLLSDLELREIGFEFYWEDIHGNRYPITIPIYKAIYLRCLCLKKQCVNNQFASDDYL